MRYPLYAWKNASKGANNSMTVESLLKKIKKFDKTYNPAF